MGNLAMGGRGKTPVVCDLARRLLARGERPAILSRGYGRRRVEEGVVIVSDGRHIRADLDRAGDEPLMMALAVPGALVLVCEVRATAAALAEHHFGATVHILDDGFQHRSLRRDVDIVLVTPADLAARRLPLGRLRSPVRSLARADAIVVDDVAITEAEAALARVPQAAGVPVFAMRRTLGAPVPLEPDRTWPGHPSSVIAVAGIANPRRFSDALAAGGWPVSHTLPFADHHRYTARDVSAMAAAVRAHGAGAVLTTEKDAMRLLCFRPLPIPIAAMPLQIAIEPADRYEAWLDDRLRHAAPGAGLTDRARWASDGSTTPARMAVR